MSKIEKEKYEHITPIMMYLRTNFDQIQEETPRKSDLELMEEWKRLSVEEKAVYEKQSIVYMRELGVPVNVDIKGMKSNSVVGLM